MGLPGHRRTSSHKRRRAAHFALSSQPAKTCPQCSQPILPHRACRFCGFYKGRSVFDADKRLKRSTRAAKRKK